MCLVDLVEFFEESAEILLGNPLPAVIDLAAHPLPPRQTTHDDFAALFHMVERIAHIVHHHFVYPERIRPHRNACIGRLERNLRPALFGEHLGLPEHTLRALPEIKDLHIEIRLVGLELGKCEELAHEFVHAPRLVENHAEILLAHLFFFAEPVLEPLRIALYQGDRGFQLVRDIRDEFPPHPVDLLLMREVVAELPVCLPELRNGYFQLLCHAVHVVAEHADFIFVLTAVAHRKIHMSQLLGDRRERAYGTCDPGGHAPDQKNAEQEGQRSHIKEKAVCEPHALLQIGDRRGHEEQGLVVGEIGKAVDICALAAVVVGLQYGIALRLL